MSRKERLDQGKQGRSLVLRSSTLNRLGTILFPKNSAAYQSWQNQFIWRRLRMTLRIALLVYLTFFLVRSLMAAIEPGQQNAVWFAMAGASILSLGLCLVVHETQFGSRHSNWIFLGCSWTITLIEQVWATAQGFAFPGVFSWTLVFLAQATLIPVRWHLHLISQLGVLCYYAGVNTLLALPQKSGQVWDVTLWLYLLWFIVICNLSVYLYEGLQRAEFQARAALEAEQEKSERLLLNILPEAVVRQLKQEQRTIAEHFAEASVLFADIVGFTQLSANIPPTEMVTLLNQIFSVFDYLAELHGLEKIKTIGDSYMVVGGLPVERDDHLEAIANMALDMQQAIARFNTQQSIPFQMRIGINSGPVIAGVIGVKKFIYDLWGDTVNTASRMESQGLPGSIQVTEAVYTRLRHHYHFEERGAIDVKGKGRMVVYLLTGKV